MKQEHAEKALNLFVGEEEKDIHKLAEAMVIVGIAILRDTGGIEFTRDFLQTAIDEKNPTVITPMKIQQH